MHTLRAASLVTVMVMLPALAACSSGGHAGDGGSTTVYTLTGGSTGGGGSPAAQVRLANLVDNGQSVDLCVALHGSGAFHGPLYAQVGASAGIASESVSLYAAVPAGQLDLRVVAAGGGCGTGVTGDFTALPAFGVSAFTLAFVQAGGATPTLQPFIDDQSGATAPDQAALRLLDATPGPLDLGEESSGTFSPWINNVQPLAVGAASSAQQGFTIDANGYLIAPAQSNAQLALRADSQSTDLVTLVPVTGTGLQLSGGAIYTLFAVPRGGGVGALLCDDQGYRVAAYTPCVLYPLVNGGSKTSASSSSSSTGSSTGSNPIGSGTASSGGSTSTGSTGTGNAVASASGSSTGNASSAGTSGGATTGRGCCGQVPDPCLGSLQFCSPTLCQCQSPVPVTTGGSSSGTSGGSQRGTTGAASGTTGGTTG